MKIAKGLTFFKNCKVLYHNDEFLDITKTIQGYPQSLHLKSQCAQVFADF